MHTIKPLPRLIQGGMGIGVSNWMLARAVARTGQMGVVSGTGSDTLLVRRLQDGDTGGHLRRALAALPLPGVADDILRRYFLPEGRPPGVPYKLLPLLRQQIDPARAALIAAATFAEVWLARDGVTTGMVGINLLTKIQLPTLPSLYGALLADVDAVLMGAGIPREIPEALTCLAAGEPAQLRFEMEGSGRDDIEWLRFDPSEIGAGQPLRRPMFLPIVSSTSLATMLARKSAIDGLIVEGPTAGGHNAPPRGETRLNERGEPLYGARDEVDLGAVAELGLPFWLAGGAGSPAGLRAALAAGATGIQVGTLFAFCDESGLAPELRQRVLDEARLGPVEIVTDPRASPTGYPFKVIQLSGTASDAAVYEQRERVCDLGYLRTAHRGESGRIDYRCPAEPVAAFTGKGGKVDETVGRKCLCNGLFADIGLPQTRSDGAVEPALLTSGDDLRLIGQFLGDRPGYHASDVVAFLLDETA